MLDVAVGRTRGTTWLVAPPAWVAAPVDGLPHGAEPLPDLLEMLGVQPCAPGAASRRALRQPGAQHLGGDTYAFVADGTDGFLFTTGGSGTAITDAVKLVGAGTATSVKYQDIAHGALA